MINKDQNEIEAPKTEVRMAKKPGPKKRIIDPKELLKKIEELEKKLEEKQNIPVTTKEPANIDEKIEEMRLKDREIVVGTFRFHEVKGGHIKFDFNKYKNDPVEKYLLVDGYRYALPRGVAKHLRDSGQYITYPGNTSVTSGIRRDPVVLNRYSFEQDDFDGLEDISALPNGIAPKNSR